jgi:acyl-coenzyme A synthetase/AMP-(fatty) acid ligase
MRKFKTISKTLQMFFFIIFFLKFQCLNSNLNQPLNFTFQQFFHNQSFLQLQSPQNLGLDASQTCSVILCSSGTTALSKGTMLSSAQCLQITRAFPQLSAPTLLCFSSLYWLSGFTVLMYSLANVTKRVITKRKFSPLLFVHLIEKYKVNVVLTPPTQLAAFVQSPVLKLADLSTIRMYLVLNFDFFCL